MTSGETSSTSAVIGAETYDVRAASYARTVTGVTCDFCGASADGNELPLTWTTAVENGRRKVFCERCSREHLRAIEGKLDSEFW